MQNSRSTSTRLPPRSGKPPTACFASTRGDLAALKAWLRRCRREDGRPLPDAQRATSTFVAFLRVGLLHQNAAGLRRGRGPHKARSTDGRARMRRDAQRARECGTAYTEQPGHVGAGRLSLGDAASNSSRKQPIVQPGAASLPALLGNEQMRPGAAAERDAPPLPAAPDGLAVRPCGGSPADGRRR